MVSQDVSRVNGAVTRSDKLDNKAWQLQFTWLLTGEEETFRTPIPATSFQPGKPGGGAWELVARIHQLSIDPDAFTGGANSYRESRNGRAEGDRSRAGSQLVSEPEPEVVLRLRADALRWRRRDGRSPG